MVSEFVAAANAICNEKGIDSDALFGALEEAVAAAYKREYMREGDVYVEMDRDTGEFRVIARKAIVENVSDLENEISVLDAQMMDADLKVGDTVEVEQSVANFGRIAAQTAKQVVMQKIREAERDAIMATYSGREGEVFTAMMQRMQNGNAMFEIGKAVAVMVPEEQIPSEFYKIGDNYKVLLKSLGDETRKALMISRGDADFVVALFKMEVPELESGAVDIKAIAREAGSRTKIAVTSNQDGVDPIGSLVGQRGMRIGNIMSELGEEKIDIVEWKADLEGFVEAALSPAEVLSVEVIDEDVVHVRVEEDQLSLAIGREGQNVRLAAKLVQRKIEIVDADGNPYTKREESDQEAATDSDAVVEVEETESTVETPEVEVSEEVVEASEETESSEEVTEATEEEAVNSEEE